MLITTSSALAEFCNALRGVPYIAVDTEFMREKSYFAHLCLVQVAHGEHVAAIDPLVDGLDLGPLRDLLRFVRCTNEFQSCFGLPTWGGKKLERHTACSTLWRATAPENSRQTKNQTT